MDTRRPLFLFLMFLQGILAQEVTDVIITVNGTSMVAETDDNFICATIDWWPHDKCNYNQCPWGNTSVLNLDLSHPFLAKAIQAFKNLRIRIGGSLQDQVLYGVASLDFPCHQFKKMEGGLFGFSHGCLQMDRWDELNHFFNKTGAIVTFGLNALYGRQKGDNGVWRGAWNSSNAYDFIQYTVSKGYYIDSKRVEWKGIGASVHAELYGKDLINLQAIIKELYSNSYSRPLLLAPGGFYDEDWFSKLLQASGSGVVNVLTHHIYNLGSGEDPNLVSKILDPNYLSQVSGTFRDLKDIILQYGPWATAWVGESGGAYNSGGPLVSDTFVNSFWYLDQLGMTSKYNTKAYCRQTLIGGNYGLLNTTTFVPNPDYYSALLWHRLMGKGVLSVHSDAPPFLRAYAHCSKEIVGVVLLFINLSNQTEFRITVQNRKNVNLHLGYKIIQKEDSVTHGLKKMVSWVGRKASDMTLSREEYHLTARDGYLQSQTMLLNGTPLELTPDKDIPTLNPTFVDVNTPILIAPLSIAFIVIPRFEAPACV